LIEGIEVVVGVVVIEGVVVAVVGRGVAMIAIDSFDRE